MPTESWMHRVEVATLFNSFYWLNCDLGQGTQECTK